jgi:N6-adenosine-specific RNA methylase IME4
MSSLRCAPHHGCSIPTEGANNSLLSLPRAGQYGCILADPPWQFRTYSHPVEGRVPQRAIQQHYAVQHADDIAALPVRAIAAPNCALFMWVVGSHLEYAMNVAHAWGFSFKTTGFVWRKPSIGMGYWPRKRTEACLLFTRGKPKRLHAGVDELIEAPRREHSRKPDEQYERIERLVAGPYVELFARQTRPGWDCWGNEVTKFDAFSSDRAPAVLAQRANP